MTSLRTSLLLGVLLLISGGCASQPPLSNSDPGTLTLSLIISIIALITLGYAFYETFYALRNTYSDWADIERRTRISGFVVGLLLTAILVAADASPTPFSAVLSLDAMPWYIFTGGGLLTGLMVILVSKALSFYQPATSPMAFVILALTALSASDLYLVFAIESHHYDLLAFTAATLIGLLSYWLLFPAARQESQPTPR